ncbi:hypothetical protein B0H14DRAFT_2602595 [Mycena olivaceomarginata]|nr:hypothetical protein B0H14DRAFT_2602595 [Mycena olivaceomarginata]
MRARASEFYAHFTKFTAPVQFFRQETQTSNGSSAGGLNVNTVEDLNECIFLCWSSWVDRQVLLIYLLSGAKVSKKGEVGWERWEALRSTAVYRLLGFEDSVDESGSEDEEDYEEPDGSSSKKRKPKPARGASKKQKEAAAEKRKVQRKKKRRRQEEIRP